jgi:peptide/nickel transport system substrate-binding protein
VASKHASIFWVEFAEQWDPKSPWHDRRVRQAASVAIDRQAINQANYLGLGKLSFNFVPQGLEYFWKPPVTPHDPRRARQLLAEAGYPNGFDAGDLTSEPLAGSGIGEPVVNDLGAVGIRLKLRLLERAAFLKQFADKSLRHVVLAGSGSPGNAATRLEQYTVTGGLYTYGTYPEIDELFSEQAREQNPRARRAILEKMQQLIHERVVFAPLLEFAYLVGIGPRVAHDGVNVIPNSPYTTPYEDLRLKP